jgi:predicted permease
MPAILSVTVPFFALVLCGYLAGRLRALPEAAIPGLNVFVLFFALPCMLFRFGAQTPVARLLNPALLGVYAAAALAVVALTVTFARAGAGRAVNLRDAAFGALVAAFPNTGFMGMPLLTALLGAAAAAPVMVTLLVDLILTTSVCLAVAQLHGSAHLALGARLREATRGPLRNPQPWAIGLGALFSAAGWRLPQALDKVVELLAGAATPVALFTIGAVLWRAGLQARRAGDVGAPPPSARDFLPVALVKLFVHPAAVFVLGSAARAAGAPLTAFELMVLTLAAALPSASNVSLLAERFHADTGRVARIILASTILAFFSFPGLATWLGASPG